MRILLTDNSLYLPALGGASKINRLIMEALAGKGHCCAVVAPSTGAQAVSVAGSTSNSVEFELKELLDSGDWARAAYRGVTVDLVRNPSTLQERLATRISEFKPDVIIACSQDPGQILLETALSSARPVVYFAQTTQMLPAGPDVFFPSRRNTELLRKTQGCIALSRFLQNYLRKYADVSASVIPLPIFQLPQTGAEEGRREFVTLINPCKVKGISIFLSLVEAMPEVSFAAVPTWGTTSQDMTALRTHRNVKILSASEDIESIFSRTRVLLVPSIWDEGYGLVAVEAMLRGIPVLASDSGGLPEAKLGVDYVVPVSKIRGYLDALDERMCPEPRVPAQDILPWKQVLRRVLLDSDDYRRVSEQSRAEAGKHVTGCNISFLEAFLSECQAIKVADKLVVNGSSIEEVSFEGMSQTERERLIAKIRQTKKERGKIIPLIPPRRDRASAPTSSAQRGIWLMEQMQSVKGLHNQCIALRLSGKLDPVALRQALERIVERHEILRTTFAEADGEPLQVIHTEGAIPLDSLDLPAVESQEKEGTKLRISREAAETMFDLAKGPLARAVLFRIDDEEHIFALIVHHILADNWSLNVFINDFAQFYIASKKIGISPQLNPLPVQYGDYAQWESERLRTDDVLKKKLSYWLDYLKDFEELRLAGPGENKSASFECSAYAFTVAARLRRRLEELAAQENATLFMLLLSGFQILLHRYSGQSRILSGSPAANRDRKELESLIGCFANSIVWNTQFLDNPPVRGVVAQVRQACLEAYASEEVPFDRIIQELRIPRSVDKHPLVQVMFGFQNAPTPGKQLGDLRIELIQTAAKFSKFDICLNIHEEGDGLAASIDYRRELFQERFIECFAAHFRAILEQMVQNLDQRVSELTLLGAVERLEILEKWNRQHQPLPGVCAHSLFEAQVRLTPDRPAVIDGDRQFSYAELNACANRLSEHLRKQGAGIETPVAVCLPRSAELAISMLAIFKAGSAYLPLDPRHPSERLATILRDSGAHLIISISGAGEVFEMTGTETILLDSHSAQINSCSPKDQNALVLPENLCYLIYTSGSSGAPKGIAMPHGAMVNMVAWHAKHTAKQGPSVVAQFAAVGFDVSIQEMLSTLCCSGTLVPISDELRIEPQLLLAYLRACRVNRLFLPVAALHQLAAEACNHPTTPALEEIIVAGEQLRITKDVIAWLERMPGCVLHNHYGPSETHVATSWTLSGPPASWPQLPSIGYPISNEQVYLLNQYFNPVPLGVAGEVYVGGAGLARGYFSQPGQTAERFVPDPFGAQPGCRLYRTGDRARRRQDGAIDFIGRMDNQVKVRGFRVELGEVEATLLKFPGVHAAAATVCAEENGKFLRAWIIPKRTNPGLSASQLRQFLMEKLPEYMVPIGIEIVQSFPLTASGKIDRNALSSIPIKKPDAPFCEPPQTTVEAEVARVWSDILGLQSISRSDNFFNLGGHSLLASKAMSRLRQKFNCALPTKLLFEFPTVAGLSLRIEEAFHSGIWQGKTEIRRAPEAIMEYPLSYAQEDLFKLYKSENLSAAYHLAACFRIQGPLNLPLLEESFSALVERHEALRLIFMEKSGELKQRINPPFALSFPVYDIAGLSQQAMEAEIQRHAIREATPAFALESGPLIRGRLLQAGSNAWVLIVVIHHLVCDGMSIEILTRDLSEIYTAFREGHLPEKPEESFRYVDFALWERSQFGPHARSKQLSAWAERLRSDDFRLRLSSEPSRVPALCGASGRIPLPIDSSLLDNIMKLASQQSVTLHMVLVTALQILLNRFTGQRLIVIGSPSSSRIGRGEEELVGLFVNHTVLVCDCSGNPTVLELLGRVRDTAIEAAANQNMPAPFAQVILTLNYRPLKLQLSGLEVQPLDIFTGISRRELFFFFEKSGDALGGFIEYRTDLFDAPSVTRLAVQYKRLLAGIAEGKVKYASELEVVSLEEQEQILKRWNGSTAVVSSEWAHEKISRESGQRGREVAAVIGEEMLTYSQLNERGNRLGHYLQAQGVGQESVVGVHLERTMDALISLLATMKIGGVYVPLDPRFPEERLRTMARQVQPAVVIGNKSRTGKRFEGKWKNIDLDQESEAIYGCSGLNPEVEIEAEQAAYIIFTSGSSGEPKGVVNTYGGLRNLVLAQEKEFGRGEGERTLMFAPLSFDASIFEVFLALGRGAGLCIAEEGKTLPGKEFLAWLRRERVGTATLPPSVWAAAPQEPVESLKRLLLAGEAPGREVLEFWGKQRDIYNAYGPTEATVWATLAQWNPGQKEGVIGRPINNVQVYVLDDYGQLAGVGRGGELCLGGASLARGYLNKPGLTAACFVPDSWSGQSGSRLYRTGDRVRWREDGQLEYLGRKDTQVKIRGYRIETGEVEEVLRQYPKVKSAAVMVREGARRGKYLAAWVVGNRPEWRPEKGELRKYLSAKLPEYMLPTTYHLLPAMPLTPHGKLDYRALSEPAEPNESPAAPLPHPIEEKLTAIWAEALNTAKIGIHDNFFELGGDSIVAIQILGQLLEAGINVTPQDIFEHPTIAGLAEIIRNPASNDQVASPLKHEGDSRLKKIIAEIWAEALGKAAVGIDENFFELGGDSIVGIQIAGRAAELGLEILPQDILQYPTISQLAAEIASRTQTKSEGKHETAGQVPLTPIQKWFLHQNWAEPHHYNQAVLLQLRRRLSMRIVEQVVGKIVEKHDALRLRFRRDEGDWTQSVAEAESAMLCSYYELSGAEETDRILIQETAAMLQSSLNLSDGPLLRVALFDSDRGLLLFIVHHLAVDVVSWRVLIEDFERGYLQMEAVGTPTLGPSVPGFVAYAKAASSSGEKTSQDGDLAFWKSVVRDSTAIPVDDPDVDDTVGDAVSFPVILTLEKTADVLARSLGDLSVPAFLLLALDGALREWLGDHKVLVEMEGHGRNFVVEGMFPAKTVGWFTTMYPVALGSFGQNSGNFLEVLRERLIASRDRALSYGVLRELKNSPELRQVRPQISLNYLGEIERQVEGSKLFRNFSNQTGPLHGSRNHRPHKIAINAYILEGSLRVDWTYGRRGFRKSTIEKLAGSFSRLLDSLVKAPQSVKQMPSHPAGVEQQVIELVADSVKFSA